jgi:hypothetical protein
VVGLRLKTIEMRDGVEKCISVQTVADFGKLQFDDAPKQLGVILAAF